MEAFIDIDSYGNCEASNDDHLLEYSHFVHQKGVCFVMTQTRFFQIWRYFHLADNTQSLPREDPGFDKIFRVRQFSDIIMENAQRLYRLEKDVSIDETMVPHNSNNI